MNYLTLNKNYRVTYRDKTYPDFNITCVEVRKESGKIIGKTLAESNLRVNYGIQVLAIQTRR